LEFPLPTFLNGSPLDVEQLDWNFPQKSPDELELNLGAHYGFNHQYSGLFTNLQADILEIIDLTDPETSTEASRREARIVNEDASFDEEYYM
jgi:protein SHQ1